MFWPSLRLSVFNIPRHTRHRSGTTAEHGGSSQDYPTDSTVGIENRSSTTTGHGGSSQDYPKDSNSWNRKQEQHNNRTWWFFTGLSKGLQQLE